MSTDRISKVRLSALGDTVTTTCTFVDGVFSQEDIVVVGPPELIEAARGGASGIGRDWYSRGDKPKREIWLARAMSP